MTRPHSRARALCSVCSSSRSARQHTTNRATETKTASIGGPARPTSILPPGCRRKAHSSAKHAPKSWLLPQRIKIRRNIACLPGRDPGPGHGRLVVDSLRIDNEADQVVGGIGENSGDIDAACDVAEFRPNLSRRGVHARYHVATTAAAQREIKPAARRVSTRARGGCQLL